MSQKTIKESCKQKTQRLERVIYEMTIDLQLSHLLVGYLLNSVPKPDETEQVGLFFVKRSGEKMEIPLETLDAFAKEGKFAVSSVDKEKKTITLSLVSSQGS